MTVRVLRQPGEPKRRLAGRLRFRPRRDGAWVLRRAEDLTVTPQDEAAERHVRMMKVAP